ncbi:MAG: phosphatidate cytidylyltransferase [Deltaproteobacteria bacterium]|nr:phosphatidate cytidylyltransferase [Deltaproteobacteria bacterium]
MPLVVAGLLLLPPVVTLIMAVAAATAGGYEVLGLFGHAGRGPLRIAGALLGGMLVAVVYAVGQRPELLLLSLSSILIVALLLGLLGTGEMKQVGRKQAGLCLAAFYPAIFLSLIALIRRDVPSGGLWIILALGTAFLSDTGAYFAGRFLGRRKLAPRLSPNKTIEGSLGGILASVLTCIAASYVMLPELPLLHAVALGVLGSIVGQAGDLVESLLKRASDAKDTGGIFPGHGGMLDRIDAAVFTTALFYGYLYFWAVP